MMNPSTRLLWTLTSDSLLVLIFQHVDIAALLIKFDACVNATDKWAFTPLHEAAQKGRTQLCALLLAHGADPTLRNQEGQSALDLVTVRLCPFKGTVHRNAHCCISGWILVLILLWSSSFSFLFVLLILLSSSSPLFAPSSFSSPPSAPSFLLLISSSLFHHPPLLPPLIFLFLHPSFLLCFPPPPAG